MGNTASHAHESLDKGFTRGTFGDVKNTATASFRSPRKMDRLRRSFRDSFRRRKDRVPESSKPHQWQADDQAVRSSTCSFPVKYLGCVEVFDSRGMQVCEEALKVLRNSRRRAIRGLLHVSGDGLRVVDDDTKGLIVDQTIEKVSFCAPDRNHERGFSYICRDGTTRRWMCHGFLASKDSGERLSHAVGCAFAVCLERKQRRDTECGVTMDFDHKTSTFTRSGSFRQQTMTERLQNGGGGGGANGANGVYERGVDIGGGAAVAAPLPPAPKPHNPFAIERPHVTASMLERLERQGSFRAVGAQSPFKRQMSLRINDLPSNAERQKMFMEAPHALGRPHAVRSVSPIPEVSPLKAQTHAGTDTVAQLCAELSQGLQLLSSQRTAGDLNFNNAQSINQNQQQQNAANISLIHSPLSPPVVSVFPSLQQTLAGAAGAQRPAHTPPQLSSPEVIGIGAAAATPSGRSPRAPTLSTQSRSRSLNASGASSSNSGSLQSPPLDANDPFDAEWVASVARLTTTAEAVEPAEAESAAAAQQPVQLEHATSVGQPAATVTATHHTNPFIIASPALKSAAALPLQSFQVQL